MRRGDRIAILRGLRPAPGREIEHDQPACERLQVMGQAKARRRIAQPAQGEDRTHQCGQRQPLDGNHQATRHRKPRDDRPARVVALRQAPEGGGEAGDLPAMMVDPERLELIGEQRHHPCDQPRPPAGLTPEQADRDRCDERHRDQQGQQRHRYQGHAFGSALPDQRGQGADDQRQRNVDQPRPVHRHLAQGIDPVLVEIEPALPGQQVTYLHEAQDVVGIGELPVRDAPGRYQQENEREQRPHPHDMRHIGKAWARQAGARSRRAHETPPRCAATR